MSLFLILKADGTSEQWVGYDGVETLQRVLEEAGIDYVGIKLLTHKRGIESVAPSLVNRVEKEGEYLVNLAAPPAPPILQIVPDPDTTLRFGAVTEVELTPEQEFVQVAYREAHSPNAAERIVAAHQKAIDSL